MWGYFGEDNGSGHFCELQLEAAVLHMAFVDEDVLGAYVTVGDTENIMHVDEAVDKLQIPVFFLCLRRVAGTNEPLTQCPVSRRQIPYVDLEKVVMRLELTGTFRHAGVATIVFSVGKTLPDGTQHKNFASDLLKRIRMPKWNALLFDWRIRRVVYIVPHLGDAAMRQGDADVLGGLFLLSSLVS